MEGLHVVRDLIRPGDLFTKLDIKDAYLHVPIDPTQRNLLRFVWEGKTYRFRTLPFGLSIAPFIFTKLLQPLIAQCRSRGIRLTYYLDDILILGRNKEEIHRHTQFVVNLLTTTGFIMNKEKSITTPTHQTTFLGFQINSKTLLVRTPRGKVMDAKRDVVRTLRHDCSNTLIIRTLAGTIGKLNALAPPIIPTRGHLRHLNNVKNQALFRTTRRGRRANP